MTFNYDLTTDIGVMRLSIPDRVNTLVEPAMFSDEELSAFLSFEGDLRRGIAQALEVIATDQALVLKVMRVQNIQTDGAKLAAELRARAKGLREQAAQEEANEGLLFGIAEQVYDVFSLRERLINEALRRGY